MDDDVLARGCNDTFCPCVKAIQVKFVCRRNLRKGTHDLALVYLRSSATSSCESNEQPDFQALNIPPTRFYDVDRSR